VRSNAWKAEVLKDYLEKIMEKSNAKFREEMEDELQNAAQVYVNKLERGLALLNGLGNIAPIVGFLGTVLGMIEAFAAIASATTVNAKVVAVGIQIALVTTAGGLLVAAPILFFYHFFTHIVQNTYTQADEIISLNTMGFPRLSEGANSKEQIQA
jgi:biopolymer transport protein ExbB/TolQ